MRPCGARPTGRVPHGTGLPPSFQNGIDAALMRGDTGQLDFFKNRRYLRYSNVADGPDGRVPDVH